MGTNHIRKAPRALDEAAARAEQMPYGAEREAAGRERGGKCTRVLDHLIRAGVREAIAILEVEGEWMRKSRGRQEP
ncbi:hypothetical protein OVA24_17000 [Luteolibacter sp. SL250]|uniref:hypothetical protein n=1 Tax=Luteolibacter sp. SL250 TaxID=2995170 RepID=UPI002271B92E|nr:hypothetical protein [Luteolibacter sp. SL250]WAC18932.1 hypothetical protein OVA24_17000 [Luteolibacter sp. SL250]